MKTLPFDLDKALAGAKVVNGRGDVVTGLHRVDTPGHLGDRLVGVVNECVLIWKLDGYSLAASPWDLSLVAPEPIVRWVNFYEQTMGATVDAEFFDTEADADAAQCGMQNASGRIIQPSRRFGRAIRVEIEPEVQP